MNLIVFSPVYLTKVLRCIFGYIPMKKTKHTRNDKGKIETNAILLFDVCLLTHFNVV